MSTIHVGPYLKCSTSKESYEHETRICSIHGNKYGHFNFCPECGTKIISVKEKKERDKVNILDIVDEIEEKLYHVADHIWVANRARPEGQESFSFDSKDFPYIRDCNQEQEMKEFKEQYQNEIKILEKYYDNVKLKYGVLNEY